MELEAELRYFSEEKETQFVSRVKGLRSLLPSSKKELAYFVLKVCTSHTNFRTKTSLLENILLPVP